jgi:hypothetical protein
VPLSNFAPRGFRCVHQSIAILYHQVPNPNILSRFATFASLYGGHQLRRLVDGAGSAALRDDAAAARRDAERAERRWELEAGRASAAEAEAQAAKSRAAVAQAQVHTPSSRSLTTVMLHQLPV